MIKIHQDFIMSLTAHRKQNYYEDITIIRNKHVKQKIKRERER